MSTDGALGSLAGRGVDDRRRKVERRSGLALGDVAADFSAGT